MGNAFKIFASLLAAFLAFSSTQAMLMKLIDGRGWRWGSRIVGGQRAPLGSVPHQVSLQDVSSSHVCGGSIISDDIIISAAHCCSSPTPTAILAGLNNLDQPEDGAQKLEVDQVVIHPNYTDATLVNDICIIHLRKSLKIGNESRTGRIPLPPSDHSASGKANVTGWGNIQEGGPSSAALMIVQVPIISDFQCRKIYGSDEVIADSMICAGEEGKGPCLGDSGGPLVDNHGYLVGIVSWGYECAQGYPGIFTQVSSFVDWVNLTVSQLRENRHGAELEG